MGKLEFSAPRIEMLGADAAFVRGSWQLILSDGKAPHGLFTLVFRKFPDAGRLCTTTHRRRNRGQELDGLLARRPAREGHDFNRLLDTPTRIRARLQVVPLETTQTLGFSP